MKLNKVVTPGGVDEYIATYSKEIQTKLNEMRSTIQQVAPGSIETTSYFQIPGYSYPGYEYNGMFAWFSVSKNQIRLHVIPPVIKDHAAKLAGYATTQSIVSFPLDKELPVNLVKELVKASIKVMQSKK